MARTSHGHHIPGTVEDGVYGPRMRCGGVGLCAICSQEAGQHQQVTNVEEPRQNKLDAFLETPDGKIYVGPATFKNGLVIFDVSQVVPGIRFVSADTPPNDGWVRTRRQFEGND